MKRTIQKIVLVCAVCAVAFYALNVQRGVGAAATSGPAAPAPQATPASTNPAMDDPAQFMWRVFVQVSQPAPGQQPPAPNASFPVMWETWATDEDTFPGNGVAAAPCFPSNPAAPVNPAPPAQPCPVQPVKRLRRGVQQQVLLNAASRVNLRGARGGGRNRSRALSLATLRAAMDAAHAVKSAPPAAAAPRGRARRGAAATSEPGGFEEVTRNLASFNFIVQNNLYTVAGLTQQFNNNFVVQFPRDAIEVKLRWLPWAEIQSYSPGANMSNYHVTFAPDPNNSNTPTYFGLVAIHLMTKDTPNWVWATWEHEDNPNRCDFLGCHDDFGVTPSDVAPTPNPAPYPGAPYPAGTLTPALMQLMQGMGAEWQHYRLKGAQVNFTDPTGQPLIVGNSVTEFGFVQTSSCMTCHALASFSPNYPANTKPPAPASLSFINSATAPPPDTTAMFYGAPGITLSTCQGQLGTLPPCAAGPPGGGFYATPFDPITNPQHSPPQFMQVDFVWAIPFGVKAP